MANLLSSLSTAGQALDVYQQALEVVQNNITNSTTPGYATQSLNIQALPFDSASGLAGGVAARGLDSSRDEYAEEEVRRQTQSLGSYQAQADGLSQVESLIDVTGNSGVSTSLDSLLQSFSAWSVTPSDSSARW
jgi:flagellar hook-associated protein 1 FlgK